MLSFLVKEVQRTPASSSFSPSLRSFDDLIPAPLRAAIRNRKHCTEMQPLKPSKEQEHEISTRLLHFTPHYCSHYHESVCRQHSFRLHDFNTSTTVQSPTSPSASKLPGFRPSSFLYASPQNLFHTSSDSTTRSCC